MCAWQTVASDGQVFAAFYAFVCNKEGRPISKRFAADNEAPLGANASRASSESLSHRVMSPHQTDQGIKQLTDPSLGIGQLFQRRLLHLNISFPDDFLLLLFFPYVGKTRPLLLCLKIV